jgi:nitrate/nitrite transport system permease protein
MNKLSIKIRGAILSVAILVFALLLWHIATAPKVVSTPVAATGSS